MGAESAFDLSGRVALVTGGSRGLGAEIVRAFAGAGADVVIASRKLEACEALAAEIEAATGRNALAFRCHVGDWGEIDALVEAVYERFAKLDVLVNNAGLSPLYDRPVDVTEALWDKVQEVNLKGPFRLMSVVGERMAAAGGGSIINVSSVSSLRPRPGSLPYAAAKAGLNALTIGFAHQFGPSVRVNCILPGPFITDISRAWDMDEMSERWSTFALQRSGEPREIIGAALYFASDASSYTTGALLSVDGGVP